MQITPFVKESTQDYTTFYIILENYYSEYGHKVKVEYDFIHAFYIWSTFRLSSLLNGSGGWNEANVAGAGSCIDVKIRSFRKSQVKRPKSIPIVSPYFENRFYNIFPVQHILQNPKNFNPQIHCIIKFII